MGWDELCFSFWVCDHCKFLKSGNGPQRTLLGNLTWLSFFEGAFRSAGIKGNQAANHHFQGPLNRHTHMSRFEWIVETDICLLAISIKLPLLGGVKDNLGDPLLLKGTPSF